MTDKKQAAKSHAPLKKEKGKASVEQCGSGQILAEYRTLLDSFYTLRIRWGDGEGQEVSYGLKCRFIDRIRNWTRTNLPDRSYGFILDRLITDISAYEYVDAPIHRSDSFSIERDMAISWIKDEIFAAIRELIGQLPAPVPKPFERTATAQYDKMLKEELPGFSICPFPKQVSIGTRHTYPTLYGGTEGNEAWVRDPARWDDIGRAVRNSGRTTPDSPLRDLLDGWSYATIVPDGIPNPNDIPNPKIYLLDGAMIPDESMERGGKRLSQVANTIIVQFGAMVRRAWESPINLRDQAVTDLLDHHFKHGGNPVAFVKHVERITPNYKVDELRGLLSGWVASKGDHNSTATTKPKPAKKSSAFTVPVLARFCWCMEKAGHSDHGIVNATAASRLANHYGLLHKRTGEKLKQERDRFDGADGKPYLKGGPRSNEAYGRRTWAAVKVELERIGYSDAVRLAEAILSDL